MNRDIYGSDGMFGFGDSINNSFDLGRGVEITFKLDNGAVIELIGQVRMEVSQEMRDVTSLGDTQIAKVPVGPVETIVKIIGEDNVRVTAPDDKKDEPAKKAETLIEAAKRFIDI